MQQQSRAWVHAQSIGADAMLPTHRHGAPYAALVLDGSYVESSLDGAMRCTAGTIVLHPAFHAHADRFGARGARLVNVAWHHEPRRSAALPLTVHDLAEASEVFMRCPSRLPELLAAARPADAAIGLPAWQRPFVAALRDSDAPIGDIARRLDVSAAHACRALLRSHGMAPRALRLEARWRRALALLCGDDALADIAVQAGFADQSHFTRVARAVAGTAPAALRRQINCVQDGVAAGMAQWPHDDEAASVRRGLRRSVARSGRAA
jgi:AraC-like DNA-binding protein